MSPIPRCKDTTALHIIRVCRSITLFVTTVATFAMASLVTPVFSDRSPGHVVVSQALYTGSSRHLWIFAMLGRETFCETLNIEADHPGGALARWVMKSLERQLCQEAKIRHKALLDNNQNERLRLIEIHIVKWDVKKAKKQC